MRHRLKRCRPTSRPAVSDRRHTRPCERRATSATIPGPDTSGPTSNPTHMTTHFPTRLLHPTPLRIATVTLCLTLGGCSVVGDWFSHGETDYKGASKRTQPLEVPPDLTQLQKDSRYLPQGGVVTASDLRKPADGTAAAAPAQPGLAPAPANPQVALNTAGNLHLEQD